MKTETIEISKFLSYVLRHHPEAIGLELDKGGWASVDRLMECAARDGKKLTQAQIAEVVATNDKKRFSLSDDGLRIRANQGHSIDIELGLTPLEPPEHLYHGTAKQFLKSILKGGLQAQSRHHVHLSQDIETAIKVGQRHGIPVVLEIASKRMNAEGYQFYRSANGVWLTDKVPPQYFEIREISRT